MTPNAATRLPLENRPLERAVIGALVADTHAFWSLKTRCRPDLFCHAFHRSIVTVLHKIADGGREFSIAAIVGRLNDAPEEGFSPEGYLATLIAEEADATDLPELIGDLEDMFARRQMIRLGEALMRQSREDNGMSAIERLEAAKAQVDAIADPLGAGTRTLYEIGQRVLARTQDASAAEKPVGYDLGLKTLQDLIGPLMPGRLYTMAGPPGSGKTALAFQVATNVSASIDPSDGRPRVVRFESLEMDGEELAERDLASRSGISADKIERASVNVDELELLWEIAEVQQRGLPLYIDSATHQTVAMIRSKAMRLKRLKGLSLLVIDHLLHIARPISRKPEHEQIRDIMQAVKQLAKDLHVPVILLTQLKKEFMDGTWQQMRRPQVGDLYGGSAVEQESDVVVFVHRPEYLLKRKEPDESAKDFVDWKEKLLHWEGIAEFCLGKRRGGAPAGIRRAYFDGAKTMFADQPFRRVEPSGSLL